MVNVATSGKRQNDHREEQQSIHTNYEAQICKFIILHVLWVVLEKIRPYNSIITAGLSQDKKIYQRISL